MSTFQTFATAVIAALILVACGGGGDSQVEFEPAVNRTIEAPNCGASGVCV